MSAYTTPVKKGMRRNSSFATSSPAKTQFRSKFSVSYEALLSGEHPWLGSSGSQSSSLNATPGSSYSNQGGSYFSPSGKKPSAPRTRFFADLLCLKVEPATLETLFSTITSRQLTDDDETGKGARIRDNVGSLWRECLRIWQDVPHPSDFSTSSANSSEEVRRTNAIDTLIELSRCILSKDFVHSSSSLDLIWIFAGGIDEADDVFEDLVSAIDEGLRGELDNLNHQPRRPGRIPSSNDLDNDVTPQRNAAAFNKPKELPTLAELLFHRRRAVHLAIIWISYTFMTNLSAYFIRRDLFVSASSLLNTIQTIVRTTQQSRTDSGGLADEDAELLRSTVRDTNFLIGLLAGLGQSSSSGTGLAGGFRAMEASSSPYFRRMCDWVDAGSMNLIREASAYDLEQAWRAFLVEVESNQDSSSPTKNGNSGASGITASLGMVTESFKKIGFSSESSTIDANLPPACTSCLLPIYLLCRANTVFVDIVMREHLKGHDSLQAKDDSQKPSFASALISLMSYLSTHGALSERSKSYSRLALLIPLTLLASPAGVAALITADRPEDIAAINLCTQRSGPLPVRSMASTDQGSSLGSFFSQFTAQQKDGQRGAGNRKQLLPFVLDTCVQYIRHNLRKRLDMPGYLICLHLVQTSIQICADRKVQLDYGEWPDVWATINSTIAFLVGRHAELQGVEVSKLGQALLSTLGLALLESDRFLQSRHDVNILVYEMVRSAESLRKLANICARSGNTNGSTNFDQRTLSSAIPMWSLIESTLARFDEKLIEWAEKKGGGGGFGLSFSVSSYLPSRFTGSGSSTPSEKTPDDASNERGSRPSSSAGQASKAVPKRLPDIQTVLTLISSLDMEQIIHVYNIELEGGGGSSVRTNSRPGQSRFAQQRKGEAIIDEEWLERAESQSLSEAFRFASEDMRAFTK